jgi:hypothetical protein
MEFVLVAHAIIVGLAVAEILRGFADTLRAEEARISYRLLLIAGWALLLLWQLWWAVWRVVDRPEWTFPEYLVFLFPVAVLYIIARLCFPERISGSDLQAYYQRVAPRIFVLVAVTYASFAFLMQPFIFRDFWPWVTASQITMAILALLASRIQVPAFQLVVIVAMVAQVIWRGLSSVMEVKRPLLAVSSPWAAKLLRGR